MLCRVENRLKRAVKSLLGSFYVRSPMGRKTRVRNVSI
jgi:hypothetical protein